MNNRVQDDRPANDPQTIPQTVPKKSDRPIYDDSIRVIGKNFYGVIVI